MLRKQYGILAGPFITLMVEMNGDVNSIANVAFVFTTFSCVISLILISISFPVINYLVADVESISVASDKTMDTLNLTGTYRSFQTHGLKIVQE